MRGLHTARRFHFHPFEHLASPVGLVPVARWLDNVLLPGGMVLRHVERGAREYLQRLLEANAARMEMT